MKRTGRFAIIVAAGVLTMLAGSPQRGRWPAALAAPPQRHAVIVGINDYADRAVLSHQLSAFSHQQLPDASPSPPPARLAECRRLIADGGLQPLQTAEVLPVFYSGHGAKEGDEAFWVTQDARRSVCREARSIGIAAADRHPAGFLSHPHLPDFFLVAATAGPW